MPNGSGSKTVFCLSLLVQHQNHKYRVMALGLTCKAGEEFGTPQELLMMWAPLDMQYSMHGMASTSLPCPWESMNLQEMMLMA